MTARKGPKPERGGKVKSLETTFQIINVIEKVDGAGITEITKEVDVAKSTVHDHVKTLERNGFLAKDYNGTYRIGLRFLDHGGLARSRLKLYQTATPEIEKLADRTGELVNLVVKENSLGVYIDHRTGENAVNLDTYLGKREHLHNTAFGKAILAHLSPSEVSQVIERHGLPAETKRTITSRKSLRDRLETVRENGYAVDNEERLEGLSCVAAPITSEEEVLGAVSISGPASRLKNDRLTNELAEEVVQAAHAIGINITYE